MKITQINNEALLIKTKELARKEREITLEVLHHLREIERRSLYAEIGYSSLFEYAVRELKYSEGAAQRRISSMRLLKSVPQIEKKIESGELSLMTLSKAQSFFKQEKINVPAEKVKLLAQLEGKSKLEVERELILRSSEPEKLIQEKLRPVSATHAELKILLDEKMLSDLEELKNLLGHTCAGGSMKELIGYSIKQTLERFRPKAPKVECSVAVKKMEPEKSPPPVAVKNSRYIPREIKRKVWARDKGQCTFEIAGKRCSCKYALELDHVVPHAMGGKMTVENLRLRCGSHNQVAAVAVFGKEKMGKYIPRLR